ADTYSYCLILSAACFHLYCCCLFVVGVSSSCSQLLVALFPWASSSPVSRSASVPRDHPSPAKCRLLARDHHHHHRSIPLTHLTLLSHPSRLPPRLLKPALLPLIATVI